ncbi:MAG TPA: hypothetical protein VLC09_10730 [Polyangiaceae bacterium]|nr:hypothetical protein [Polyangiaceae bacterium]
MPVALETFVYLAFWLARHEFTALVGCLALAALALGQGAAWDTRAEAGGGIGGRPLRYLAVGFAVFGFVNLFAGELWVNPLVVAHGVKGQGMVVKSEATNVKVNKVTIRELTALLRVNDGQTVEATFRSNDGVVVPSSFFHFVYPPSNVRFNVLHLPHHPEAFVVLADDDSPYARSLRCGEIAQAAAEARARFEFDPANPESRASLEQLELALVRCRE